MIRNSFIEKARQLVSPLQGEWSAPPTRVPYDHQVDGPLLGNGDMGVVLGGTDGSAIWHISKVDFWESRYPFPSGGPRPIGCIQVTGPTGGWHAQQKLYTAQVDCQLGAEGAPRLHITSFVSAQENLLILRLRAQDGEAKGTIALTPHPGTGTQSDRSTTQLGVTKLSQTLYRGFTDEGVAYPSEVMAAMTVLPHNLSARIHYSQMFGGAPILEPLASEIPYTLADGQEMTVVFCAVTNHDAAAFRTMAVAKAESIEEEDIAMLQQLHRGWWERFYARSYIELDDPLLMKYYYSSFYILASCSRNSKFPPGLIGVWITTDMPAWASDYHFNYNHEAPWWGCYTAGYTDLTEPYEQPMLEYVPKARESARKYEGCPGIYFDVGIGPQGFTASAEPNHYEDNHYFLGQKSNAVFIASNMILRWRKTYDLDYAAKIYSFLKDAVLFYQTYAEKEDGVYNIYNDSASEVTIFNWRITYATREDLKQFKNKNTIQVLALLRMVIPALLEVSEALQVDAPLRDGWKEFLEHLAPYPTAIAEDGKEYLASVADKGFWSGNQGDYDFRHALHLTIPCGLTGMEADPSLRKQAQEIFWKYADNNWFHFNMFCMVYPTAARLGYDPDKLLEKLAGQCKEQGFANLWTYHGGGGIEDLSAVPQTLQEMLLQSYEGVVRLVPNWPKGKPAAFGGWLADGAFEVDAAYDGQTVTHLEIRSLKGHKLVLQNPWPGKDITVHTLGTEKVFSGERICLDTQWGQSMTFSSCDTQ